MAARDEKIKEFIDSYHKALDGDMAALRRSNEEENVPLIMAETEEILGLLLDLAKPSHILELGTAHGYSALFFAKKLPGAHITTIERNPVMAEAAVETFEGRVESERIELLTGEASSVLQRLCEEIETGVRREYDFVFIDAGKSHYREFFELSEKICTKDAMLVCDNTLIKGWVVEPEGKAAKRHRTNIKYMREFLDYISCRDDLEVTLLSGGDGLAIIRYRNNDR